MEQTHTAVCSQSHTSIAQSTTAPQELLPRDRSNHNQSVYGACHCLHHTPHAHTMNMLARQDSQYTCTALVTTQPKTATKAPAKQTMAAAYAAHSPPHSQLRQPQTCRQAQSATALTAAVHGQLQSLNQPLCCCQCPKKILCELEAVSGWPGSRLASCALRLVPLLLRDDTAELLSSECSTTGRVGARGSWALERGSSCRQVHVEGRLEIGRERGGPGGGRGGTCMRKHPHVAHVA